LITGERINAVIPPAACDGCAMAIRLFPNSRLSLDDLAERGTFSRLSDAKGWLANAVQSGMTGLVSGGMRSGKTTLTGALIAEIEHDRRLVVVEDTRELTIHGENVVRTEAARRDGEYAINLQALLRNAMRQSPHTIVIGEIRDGVAAAVALESMQLGHPVLTTLHASSAGMALRRLTKLALRQDPQIPYAEMREEILDVIDFVAHLALMPDGSRQLAELLDVTTLRDA
jgi:Flp pilus assembly CpaF family ATPase